MITHDEVYNLFAKYGFAGCPLSDRRISYCINAGFSLDQIYSVGCDVYAGFSFLESFDAAWERSS